MGKVKYHDIVEQLTGALDSKKYGESHGMRLVSRHRKGSGSEHQIYFMQKHEGAWSEGATRNRELIKAAQKRAHAIEKAARKPEECSAEAVAEAVEWQERFEAYRAELKEGEKGYGSLYTYGRVRIKSGRNEQRKGSRKNAREGDEKAKGGRRRKRYARMRVPYFISAKLGGCKRGD